MKYILLLLTAAVPASAQVRPGLPPRESRPATDGAIVVTVANTRGEPLAGAWVILEGNGPPTADAQPERISRHGSTDAAGRARFANLPNGHYSPQVRMAGRHFENRGNTISLEGPKAQGSLDLILPRKPVLTGRVFDSRGAPLERAQVRTYRQVEKNGEASLVQGRSASTDDRGVYRIALAEPGVYFLMASHTERSFPFGSAPRSTGIAFYPNSPDLLAAAPIEVAFDQAERTLDVALPDAPPTSLAAAIVSGPSGKPCGQCSYALYKVDGPYRYDIVRGGGSRARGFSYAGIPPGLYRIYVEDRGRNPGWWAIHEVVVPEGRPAETLIATQPPLTLSGRIDLQEPPKDRPELAPESGPPIRIQLTQENQSYFSSGGGRTDAQLEFDETDFRFDSLAPGRYRANVWVQGADAYLAGVSRQGRALRSPTLDLTQPGPWTNLELIIRFDPAQPKVRISAPAAGSDPTMQYRVEIAPDLAENPFGAFWNGGCLAENDCHAGSLPPGRYRIVATAGKPYTHIERSEEDWAALRPWTKTVTLTPGQNPTIRLTPAPAAP